MQQHHAVQNRRLRKHTLAAVRAACIALACLAGALASAQERFPSRPLTIVVPYGAGGGPDVNNRIMAEQMRKRLGWQVLVENRPGANAMLGASHVAKSAPDGHTILFGTNANIAAAPAFFKSVPYDPIRDFAGIAIISESVFALLLTPEQRGLSFPAFIAEMRKNPNAWSLAGPSASYELLDKMIRNTAKLDHLYVRYADSAKMTNDLLGRRISGMYVPVSSALPLIRNNQAYAIAVSSAERIQVMPDTPAIAETYPDIVLAAWSGYWAPAKTPRAPIDILSKAILDIYRDQELAKRVLDGGRARSMPPDEVDAFTRRELPRWINLIKSAGIAPE